MSRRVDTTLDDVLSMVACAEDYGHGGQIAMHFFWTLVGEKVSDKEIAAFLKDQYLSDKARERGYGKEDADNARRAIQEWRVKYEGEER